MRCTIVSFLLLFLLIVSTDSYGETNCPPPASIPGIVKITASIRETPPEWAIMERHLIKTMEEAAPLYLKRFVRRGGTPYGGGPYDDVYEMFFNWCLFYSIGADEKFLDRAVDEYNAITRHCTPPPLQPFDYFHQLFEEFPEHDDWFHISEGMMAFYDFGVADPTIPENIERAKRFAGLYLNEDPDAKNFDFEHKLIPSIATGSKGAMDSRGSEYDIKYGHASLYPVLKELEPDWDKSSERRKEIQKLFDDIVVKCDVPVNLGATGLVANAYLYTGDEKYKKWVLEYVDAWMKRIKENNGILPDNIGRTGKIGEYRNGQWWGGLYGWTGLYSLHMIFGALTVASECAYLLSGDPVYLDLLRSQIDVLLTNSISHRDGLLLVPYKYGPTGWTDFNLFPVWSLAHLWHGSMNQEDWQRIQRVKKGTAYYLGKDKKPREVYDWNLVPSAGDRSGGISENARLMYYGGENPDWPVNLLKADYQEVIRRVEFMRNDPRDIYSINSDDLYQNNPVITKGLQQVTMGAPQTIYNGGLLCARVRYFDIDRARPGLPEDVSALVEGLQENRTVVNLINLSLMHSRNLIVQAGAFGEHEFTEVKFWQKSKDGKRKSSTEEIVISVNKKYFTVELPPAASIRLDIGTKRFVNQPSYAFPWHGDKVPVK